MPASVYKVSGSPSTKNKSEIPTIKEDESPAAQQSSKTNDSTGRNPKTSSEKTVNGNGIKKSSKTTSKETSDQGKKKNTNGILKNKNPEEPKKEKWELNYVPVCDLNDNSVMEAKTKSTKIVEISKPKEVSPRSAATNEHMVRKVSEIFEEVFQEQRGHWTTLGEYFLSSLAMPIAFSSLWRFPYLISNYGGGAFLFCYVFLLVIVGMPLYFMESILGQFSQLSCVHVWRCAPLMQGVGVAMIVLSLITSIYNSQIIAYVVHYFFASFFNTSGSVLWADCKGSWSKCDAIKEGTFCYKNETINQEGLQCHSSSGLYWQDEVLRVTELDSIGRTGPIHWDLALCLVFVWIVVLAILVRGVKSLGKFAFLSGIIPICILFAFLIATIQIDTEGAMQGLMIFYAPEWDRLMEADVWLKAVEQVIFSLSISYGTVMTFGSYKKIRNTAESAPIILVIANLLLSVLASTTVFAMLGALANSLNIENIQDLFTPEVSNIELLFTKLPEAIAVVLPVPHAWSVFFFLMLLLFGLQSQAALIESICTTVYDALPKMRKKKVVVVSCLVLPLFLFSLPFSSSSGIHIHRLVETTIIGPNVILLVIIELFALQFIYGVRRFSNDCSVIMKKQISIYWKVCWVFICPLTLIVLFIFAAIDWRRLLLDDRREDKKWALYMSWTLSLLPLAMIPLTFVFTFFYKLCKKEPVMQPSYLWGPGCPKLREKLMEKSENCSGVNNEAYN